MCKYPWKILNGEKFEDLIQELLYFEEPNCILYDRSGKDSGIDAISFDKMHVYQMKYVSSMKMDDAIVNARKELNKIREYRKEGNTNFDKWKNVNHWTLISTITINFNDKNKWENKIINQYKDLNIKIDFWHISAIEARLDQYEFLVDKYFHNINPCICNLEDFKNNIKKSVLKINFDVFKFINRDKEFLLFDEFINSDKQFFIINGTYSIGKSRFLYECGKKLEIDKKIVFVGIPEIMKDSDVWFNYFTGYSKKSYLLIDEPDSVLLNKLLSYVNSSCKVIITLSKSSLENCNLNLENRNDVVLIDINQLNMNQSYEMVDSYGVNFREITKNRIFSLSKGIPGIIDLILLNYGKNKRIPFNEKDIYNYIRKYVEKTLNNDLSKLLILRYLSAWKSIEDDNNESQVMYLSNLLCLNSDIVRKKIYDLVGAGLVKEWESNSFKYKCEPPLLRFSVLFNWFVKENPKNNEFLPSKEFKHFLYDLLSNDIPRRDLILKNLVEFLTFQHLTKLSDAFCSTFFKAFNDALIKTNNITEQIKILDIVRTISHLSPENTFEIIQTLLDKGIKSNKVNSNTKIIIIKDNNDQSDLYYEIIKLLEHLVRYNNSTSKINLIFNGIKYVYDVFSNYNNNNVIEAFNGFITKIFEDKVTYDRYKFYAFKRINVSNKFDLFNLQIASGLLRSRKNLTESFNNTFNYSYWFIHEDENDWKLACQIKKQLFNTLYFYKSDFRIKIWEVIKNIHFDWRQSAFLSCNSSFCDMYLNEVKSDLSEIYSFLSKLKNSVNTKELFFIHKIWAYLLLSNDENDECFKLAQKCELLYSKFEKFRYYRYFSDSIRSEENEALFSDIKRLFSCARSTEEILIFFNNAWEYLSLNEKTSPSYYTSFAYTLANNCFDLYRKKGLNKYKLFVTDAFKSCSNAFLESFLVFTLRCIIIDLKSSNKFSIRDLTKFCFNKKWIYKAYAKSNIETIGRLSESEFMYFLNSDFNSEQLVELLPLFINFNMNEIKRKVEIVFSSENSNLDVLFATFVKSLYNSLISNPDCNSKGLFIWLIEKLLIKFNLNADIFDNYQFSSIKDICLDKIDQDLFYKLIASRIRIEKKVKSNISFTIWPSYFQIHNWVSDITSETAVNNMCKLVISNKTYLSLNILPVYLSYMDKKGCIVLNFVNKFLTRQNNSYINKKLFNLASLASGYKDDSDSWIMIAKSICDYIGKHFFNGINKFNIYFALLPKEESHSLDLDSFKYEKRFEKAKHLLSKEPEDSTLYSYREWAKLVAENDFKQYQEIIEGEDYE